MPKAADLDCNNRVEIATHASRYLTIFFVRCGDRVSISKEFKASATDRLDQLLAVSDANIKVQPEGAFQFHIKRMQQTLHCIQDSTASPYPGVALTLIQAAACCAKPLSPDSPLSSASSELTLASWSIT